jgi:hypothetical protein
VVRVVRQMINMSSSLTGNFGPINKICQHFCAVHPYAHDITRQVGRQVA